MSEANEDRSRDLSDISTDDEIRSDETVLSEPDFG